MKRIILVLVAVLLHACGSRSISAPSSVPGVASATLPSWLFAYQGKLVRPKPGTYGVYLSPEMADPEAAAHLEQMMAAANDLTGGEIRFVRSMDSSAPVKLRIDPGAIGQGNLGEGVLSIDTNSRCVAVSITFRDRASVMNDIPLHELGHFLFGPGHSDVPNDIMNMNRDFSIPRFSAHEYQLWAQAHEFPAGTTP